MTAGDNVQVEGEEVKLAMPSDDIVDLRNRDPEEINQHLKVTFFEIFAEPHPTIFSFDKIWQLSFQVFTTTKLWCYRIITVVCGLPCAVFWGCNFACISFCHIWLAVPGLRAWFIEMECLKRFFTPCMDTFIAPCFLAYGKCFSSIRIYWDKE